MNKLLDDLWTQVCCHPVTTPNIIRAIKDDITFACQLGGVDRFTYTRNKLQSTLVLLDMGQRNAN